MVISPFSLTLVTRHLAMLLVFGCAAALCMLPVGAVDEPLKENLKFTPISNGLLLAHFTFVQSYETGKDKGQLLLDYGTFPPAIAEVVEEYGLEEFRLSFGRGRWDLKDWGQPPFHLASTGIQLHAWFKPAAKTADYRWERLTHKLSGLLCGSIGLLNEAKTSVPKVTIGRANGQECEEAELRFGALPREAVCTENLTPWVKMLPCMSNAGLASLLNPIKIYDSRFNLMDLWVSTRPTESGLVITLTQSLAVVFDLKRWEGDASWSLSTLFDRRVEKLCPLAEEGTEVSLYHDEAISDMTFKWSEKEKAGETILNSDAEGNSSSEVVRMPETIVKFKGPIIVGQDLGVEYRERRDSDLKGKVSVIPPGRLPASELSIVRFITGSGQEKGTLKTKIQNLSKLDIEVTVLEVIPWYMRIYLHTMSVSVGSRAADLDKFLYSPAIDRVKPSQLEWIAKIPSGAQLVLEIEFDMTLLRYSEYPLDPARGFDVNGALIKFKTADGKTSQIVSSTILLTLPTPDFTMPFNVIMLTSLAMTFFYGYLFNLVFRRFYLYDPKNPRNLAGRIALFFRHNVLKQKLD